MNEGTVLVGKTDEDMIEFLQYIRSRGGECVCTDFSNKTVEVIRGTVNEEKIPIYTGDGILGRVDVGDADLGERKQTYEARRGVLP